MTTLSTRGSFAKVAIVGYTDHRALAPFGDPSWKIWGLNDLYYELPDTIALERLEWFQVHPWAEVAHWEHRDATHHPLDFRGGPPHPRDPNHVPWLREFSQRMPIWLMEEREELPGALLYPKLEAYRYFSLNGETPNRYFTNTISWMIAKAIMDGYEEIGVYGVDMMMGGGTGSEYGWQRPSCEFFLGWARGAGIKVHLPDESDLLKTAFVYGDPAGTAFRKKVQKLRATYEQRRIGVANEKQSCTLGEAELRGALNALEHLERAWMPGDSEQPVRGRAPVPGSHREIVPVTDRFKDLAPASDNASPEGSDG